MVGRGFTNSFLCCGIQFFCRWLRYWLQNNPRSGGKSLNKKLSPVLFLIPQTLGFSKSNLMKVSKALRFSRDWYIWTGRSKLFTKRNTLIEHQCEHSLNCCSYHPDFNALQELRGKDASIPETIAAWIEISSWHKLQFLAFFLTQYILIYFLVHLVTGSPAWNLSCNKPWLKLWRPILLCMCWENVWGKLCSCIPVNLLNRTYRRRTTESCSLTRLFGLWTTPTCTGLPSTR